MGDRPFGEALHIPFRGKDIHFLGEQLNLDRIHELLGVLQFLLPLQQLAEPGKPLYIPLVIPFPFLVFPVGGDARLGNPVHFRGPDLDLHPFTQRADNGGMERLVHVALGHGDIVFEPARNRLPGGMYDAEYRIAGL